MGRKLSVRCGALVIIVGILLVFVLAGCGSGEEEEGGDGSVPPSAQEASVGEEGPVPASPQEASEVHVRVSGAQGTAYSGNYGTLRGEQQFVEDSLGEEPQEYEVDIEEGRPDGITAVFEKSESSAGELKVQIVADDELVAESRTRVPTGAVIVDWVPEGIGEEEPEGILEEEPEGRVLEEGEMSSEEGVLEEEGALEQEGVLEQEGEMFSEEGGPKE